MESDLPERLQLNVKSARLSQIYKRLDPDKPAYTITGAVEVELTCTTGEKIER